MYIYSGSEFLHVSVVREQTIWIGLGNTDTKYNKQIELIKSKQKHVPLSNVLKKMLRLTSFSSEKNQTEHLNRFK